ncbi:unnamed protein product, partial [Ceratitis capitata]
GQTRTRTLATNRLMRSPISYCRICDVLNVRLNLGPDIGWKHCRTKETAISKRIAI